LLEVSRHADETLLEPPMITLTATSAPASNLLDYWNQARLHVASARSTSVRPAPRIVPWRSALEDVLKVGYAVMARPRFVSGTWTEVRWRTTPSAGALYPFELIATVVGEGSYLWDVEQGRLLPCDAPPLAAGGLAEAGLVARPGQRVEALVTFVARPWLSMKKYRLRGYAYCHLDVGHVAANLALYMAGLGHDPVLHLRFSRAFQIEHLRLAGMCREPLAVLSFAGEAGAEPADGAGPARPGCRRRWVSRRRTSSSGGAGSRSAAAGPSNSPSNPPASPPRRPSSRTARGPPAPRSCGCRTAARRSGARRSGARRSSTGARPRASSASR
jgi:hypothetical protein